MRCNVEFVLLSKETAQRLLPELFLLLYENRKNITPGNMFLEEERSQFLENVLPALEKPQRKLVQIVRNGKTVGFCMYYVNQGTLMIEELQLKKAYHNHGIPYFLGRFLLEKYDAELKQVQAYAEENNLVSRNLMKRLGFTERREREGLFHYACAYEELRGRFAKT